MTTTARLLLASALLATTALPVDREIDDFDGVVRHVEKHYGKQRLWIPFMGAVSFFSNAARPLGASDFKLAVIEGIDGRRADPVDVTFGERWRPVIRVRERDGEAVNIMAREDGHRAVKLLMLVVDGNDAVVMQMRMSPSRFLSFIAEKARERHGDE